MAKALSHIHSTIRGSVGGLTYSANQYAQILMKTRTAPVQPNTNPQTLIRSCVNGASQRWEALSDQERSDWDLYATTVVYTGPQGTYQLTGRQIFIAGVSLQLYLVGISCPNQTVDDDPPTNGGKLVFSAITPGLGPPAGTGIGFSIVSNSAEDAGALISVSPPQNPTRMRYKGPWDPTLTEGINVPKAASLHHTIVCGPAGKVFFVRIRGVTESTPARVTSVEYLRLTAATLP